MVAVPQGTLINELHYIFVIASFASRLLGDVLRHCSFRSKVGRVTEWGYEYGSTSGILQFYTGRTFTRQYNLSCR